MSKPISSPSKPGQRGTVFVVDDHPALVEFACATLQAAGYAVESFNDPKEVLQAMETGCAKPAVLVTDYEMGDINGLQLIETLQKTHPGLKTVLLSGTVDSSVTQRHPGRVDRFLSKPYQGAQLRELVDELVRA